VPDTKEGHWTEEEHELFLKCWSKYGKSWKKLSEIMKTRTNEQIRTHAQKYFQKLRELRYGRPLACVPSSHPTGRSDGPVCAATRGSGYQGSYTMDGTRHLTKSFLKRARASGRVPTPVDLSEVTAWPCGVVRKGPGADGLGRLQPLQVQASVTRRVSRARSAPLPLPRAESRSSSPQPERNRIVTSDGRVQYTTRSGRTVTAAWNEDDEYYRDDDASDMDVGSEEEDDDEEYEGDDYAYDSYSQATSIADLETDDERDTGKRPQTTASPARASQGEVAAVLEDPGASESGVVDVSSGLSGESEHDNQYAFDNLMNMLDEDLMDEVERADRVDFIGEGGMGVFTNFLQDQGKPTELQQPPRGVEMLCFDQEADEEADDNEEEEEGTDIWASCCEFLAQASPRQVTSHNAFAGHGQNVLEPGHKDKGTDAGKPEAEESAKEGGSEKDVGAVDLVCHEQLQF
jgi:SHAQKYF class myb-like DNA-binding protein